MNLEQILARMAALRPDLDAYIAYRDAGSELTDENHVAFRAASTEWVTLDEQRAAAEQAPPAVDDSLRAAVARFAVAYPGDGAAADTDTDTDTDPGTTVGQTVHRSSRRSARNPWDRDVIVRNAHNPSELLARAVDATALTPHGVDANRQVLTRMLEQHGDSDMAELVLATTSPEYKSAFAATLRSAMTGSPLELSADERMAMRFAERVAANYRAMSSSTNGAGGYLIPTDIEPQITLTAAGTTNPLYSAARREPTMGNVWREVGSGNAAWSWDAQNAEVSDDATTLTNTDITLFSANGFIPISIELTTQVSQIMAQMQRVLGAGWMDIVAAALATGTGSGQPKGLVTALVGTASEVETASSGTFAVGDLFATRDALRQRHRRNATWAGNIAQYGRVQQFATDDGFALWSRLDGAGVGSPMLGRPTIEVEEMDDTATAGKELFVLGDMSNYVVAEGMGTLVEAIPHVFGSNGRPIGARGLYAKSRLGADVVNIDAFRVLQVKA